MSARPGRPLEALIVDDDPDIRWLVSRSLIKEGFQCDTAEDGEEAHRLSSIKQYDLVVTDLKLPCRNGHSLVLELLIQQPRPVIVVLTGIIEPLLAKDLMARGVDDIEFKPVQFTMFAIKLRSLVDRHHAQTIAVQALADPKPDPASPPKLAEPLPRIEKDAIYSRLGDVRQLLPVSEAAMDVFQLAANLDSDLRQIAAATQRDPALLTEVLRLANSSFFNTTGRRITDVEHAVTLLGQKRVGELALGVFTVSAVAQKLVPFLNLDRVWRRCLAAGICLESLGERFESPVSHEGLLVAALLHPAGRIVLATLFPDIYQSMLSECHARQVSLDELEAEVFAESPGTVAAHMLAGWGIPDEIHRPLRYLGLPFHALTTLPEPTRSRVEITKIAILMGNLVVGQFDPWDRLDFPAAHSRGCRSLDNLPAFIWSCRDDLANIANFSLASASGSSASPGVEAVEPSRELAYLNLSGAQVDFLSESLACAGVGLIESAEDLETLEGTLLINGQGLTAAQLAAKLPHYPTAKKIVAANFDVVDRIRNVGTVLSLPCSFSRLQAVCRSRECVPEAPSKSQFVQATGFTTDRNLAAAVATIAVPSV